MAHGHLLPSLLLLVLNVLPTSFTLAFTAVGESNCTNFTFPDSSSPRGLCYSIQVTGPSPAMFHLSNGTDITEYVGNSTETYIFENDLEGLVTQIQWDEAVSLVDCVATVSHGGVGADMMTCKSCALCDNGTSVSADCSNLEQGRNVECGENSMMYYNSDDSFESIPFFPFVQAFEHTVSGGGGTPSSSTTAPAPAPAPPSSSAAVSLATAAMATTGGASAVFMMLLAL